LLAVAAVAVQTDQETMLLVAEAVQAVWFISLHIQLLPVHDMILL
jgi:hypothetical protein